MQKNKILWKGIVVGVIFLFLIMAVVSLTGSIEKISNQNSYEANQLADMEESKMEEIQESSEVIEWWDNNWSFRKQIIIDHTKIESDLQNFPILFYYISSDFTVHAKPDGDDFVFTDDLRNKLNHEIEYYNSTDGELVAWVNVTYISSTVDTVLYLYYNNSNCENQQNVIGTWDSNYILVLHMNNMTDSTSYHNDFTNVGTSDTSGKIVGSRGFDGSNNYMNLADNPSFSLTDYTIETWFNTWSFSDYQTIIVQKQYPLYLIDFEIFSDYRLMGQVQSGVGTYTSLISPVGSVDSTHTWYHTSLIRENAIENGMKLLLNGSEIASTTDTTGNCDNTGLVCIGRRSSPIERYFIGAIDELRISNIARPTSWINTSYLNQNEPDSFLSIGSQQTNGIYVDDDYNSSTTGWQITHFDSIQDGIDSVGENGTVYVNNGLYYESIFIDKNIALLGEEKNTTIIDGGGIDDVVYVSANGVNICGFKIQNSGTYWSHNAPDAGIEVRANNVVISGNSLSNNGLYGIYVRDSSVCVVSDNIVEDNGNDGIYLHYSYNNTVSGNIVRNNYDDGISIKESQSYNNEIKDNDIYNNNWGFVISDSANNNIIYHNNIFDNNVSAYDVGTNTWDNGYPSGGNYYSDYVGEDNDGDGIGDIPYDIVGGSNQDLYPLMYPWYSEHPDTVYVDNDYNISTPGFGYNCFNMIQHGINEVDVGGTVYVYNGTYYENVLIDKTVNLMGENKNTSIINGNGTGDCIYMENQEYVNISDFTIMNASSYGIYIYNYVWSDTGSVFIGHNVISNCIVSDNAESGIYLVSLGKSCKPIDNKILDCIITGNIHQGIYIKSDGNHVGILDTMISNCTISFNSEDGIRQQAGYFSSYVYNSQIMGCTINNNVGIGLNNVLPEGTNNNYDHDIYHNNFIDNIQNAYDGFTTNNWYNPFVEEGNYWSDYTGVDINGDGVGDTPYDVTGGSTQDIYPLMNPYGSITNIETSEFFITIQGAIDDPDTLNGHTIYTTNGTYYENIIIDKTIYLIGEDKNSTIIDGNIIGDVITITSDDVNITEFKIRNSGYSDNCGIKILSDSNDILDNILSDNDRGIQLSSSNNNILMENSLSNNIIAIEIGNSYYNEINNNQFNVNNYGFSFNDLSKYNNITENYISTSYVCGIIDEITGCNNTIYHNNLVDNAVQATTSCFRDTWDNGYPSGGNYWSDYTGLDNNNDGIGDTPYEIPGSSSSKDNYPLMNPWDGTEPQAKCGDANADGILNVSDAVFIINYIFIPGFPAPSPFCPADANGDGSVDVSDAVYLINYLFIPGSPSPVDGCCG